MYIFSFFSSFYFIIYKIIFKKTWQQFKNKAKENIYPYRQPTQPRRGWLHHRGLRIQLFSKSEWCGFFFTSPLEPDKTAFIMYTTGGGMRGFFGGVLKIFWRENGGKENNSEGRKGEANFF